MVLHHGFGCAHSPGDRQDRFRGKQRGCFNGILWLPIRWKSKVELKDKALQLVGFAIGVYVGSRQKQQNRPALGSCANLIDTPSELSQSVAVFEFN
jgi:hypothetical protein